MPATTPLPHAPQFTSESACRQAKPRRRAGTASSRTGARLSPSEELAIVLAAKDGGGAEREELVGAFLPLIGSVARIYRGRAQIDRAELMQEGVCGLLRALERFDPNLDTPFWMYASWWVRQAMQHLVSELARPIVLSDRALRKLARIKDVQREHLQRHGREPSTAELGVALGMPREKVESLMAAERSPRALDEPVGADREQGVTLGELIDDPCATEAFDRVPQRLDIERLPEMLATLDQRERRIICSRFGLEGDECTLRELGEDLGVSAERVRQIESASLGKLRDQLLA